MNQRKIACTFCYHISSQLEVYLWRYSYYSITKPVRLTPTKIPKLQSNVHIFTFSQSMLHPYVYVYKFQWFLLLQWVVLVNNIEKNNDFCGIYPSS